MKKANILYTKMPCGATLTAIWISRLQMLRSCSLLTYIRLSAYRTLPLPFTKKTIEKPPINIRQKIAISYGGFISIFKSAHIDDLENWLTFSENFFHCDARFAHIKDLPDKAGLLGSTDNWFIFLFDFLKNLFHCYTIYSDAFGLVLGLVGLERSVWWLEWRTQGRQPVEASTMAKFFSRSAFLNFSASHFLEAFTCASSWAHGTRRWWMQKGEIVAFNRWKLTIFTWREEFFNIFFLLHSSLLCHSTAEL